MANIITNCVCFLSASRQAGFVHPAGALRAPRKNGFPCGNALSFPRSTGPSGRPSLARAPRRPFHLPRSGSPPRCGSVPHMHASAFQNTRFPSPKNPRHSRCFHAFHANKQVGTGPWSSGTWPPTPNFPSPCLSGGSPGSIAWMPGGTANPPVSLVELAPQGGDVRGGLASNNSRAARTPLPF